MIAIYDDSGNHLGFIPLTEQQRTLLDAGQPVTLQYHTPQLMRGTLGSASGTITLSKQGDRITTATVDAFKEFVAMQTAIKAMGES